MAHASRRPFQNKKLLAVIIPVMLIVPAMFMRIPPAVISAPATFPLRFQVAPAAFRLGAVFAVALDRLIQLRLCFFDAMLAFRVVIVTVRRRRGHEHGRAQRCGNQGRSGQLFKGL